MSDPCNSITYILLLETLSPKKIDGNPQTSNEQYQVETCAILGILPYLSKEDEHWQLIAPHVEEICS